MIALIDSDIVAYKIAFVCKNEEWFQVQHTVDAHIMEILHNTKASDFKCYLTGSRCRRREKYSDYKGQRKQEKPKWHTEIREYLISDYNAIVTDNGDEADDWIAKKCRKDWDQKYIKDRGVKTALRYIACSSDKDFNTFPGWHYNPDKKVKYWVSEEDADLFFWSQMIMGDTTDNIKGIPRKGKMAAYKILSEAVDPKLAVIAQYKIAFEDDWEETYNKNYELLKIG